MSPFALEEDIRLRDGQAGETPDEVAELGRGKNNLVLTGGIHRTTLVLTIGDWNWTGVK